MTYDEYINLLKNVFDFLVDGCEKNSFYSPTRQEICQKIFNSKFEINDLEKAVQYLKRRVFEQDLQDLIKSELCSKLFECNYWNKVWKKEYVVLENGKVKREI